MCYRIKGQGQEDGSRPPQLPITLTCEPGVNHFQREIQHSFSTVATAYVLRFAKQLKRSTTVQEMTLAPDEMAEAERLWIIQSQSKLIQDKQFGVWKKQFGLFLDETGRRCGGRLGNADIPYGTRHPIFLTKQHFLTTPIVRNAHERVMHNGVKDTN